MNFESELKKGVFLINECTNCKKIVWPPSKLCSNCFSETKFRAGDKKGRIIEFSKKEKEYFCLAEFENEIRIMGTISKGIPKEGGIVEIEKCGVRDGTYFFEFKII